VRLDVDTTIVSCRGWELSCSLEELAAGVLSFQELRELSPGTCEVAAAIEELSKAVNVDIDVRERSDGQAVTPTRRFLCRSI